MSDARSTPPGAAAQRARDGAPRRGRAGLALLVVGALGIGIAAVLPGRLSPLAPLVNDWIPSLDHRDVLVVAHLLGYGLAVPIAAAVLRSVLRAVVAVGILSLLVEGVQAFVPWRTADWTDVGWNAVALVLGAAIAVAVRSLDGGPRRAGAAVTDPGSRRGPPPPGGPRD